MYLFSGKGNVSSLLSNGWEERSIWGEPEVTKGVEMSTVCLKSIWEFLVLFLKMSSKFEIM